jgi:hypothetical protein
MAGRAATGKMLHVHKIDGRQFAPRAGRADLSWLLRFEEAEWI